MGDNTILNSPKPTGIMRCVPLFRVLSPSSAITERRSTTNHPNNAGQKNGIYPNIYILRLIMTVLGQKMVKYYEYYRVRVNLERDKGN
jgi:hypothetical protein